MRMEESGERGIYRESPCAPVRGYPLKIRKRWWEGDGNIPPDISSIIKGNPFVRGALCEIETFCGPIYVTHSIGCAEITLAVSKAMNFSPIIEKLLIIAALLHDVGKNSVGKEILLKPGDLSLEERELIKTHPRGSFNYLMNFDEEVARIVVGHHEKTKGYPRSGEERRKSQSLPLPSQKIRIRERRKTKIGAFPEIISVVDIIEATGSDNRPYGEGRVHRKKMKLRTNELGIFFSSSSSSDILHIINLLRNLEFTQIHPIPPSS